MSDLLPHLKRVMGDLDQAKAHYALVGGMAISLRTQPRFTRDLDVAVAVRSDQDAEALSRFFIQRRYRLTGMIEHESAHRLSTIRLAVPETNGVIVDLLFASCGIEPEIVAKAEWIDVFPDLPAPVARAEHLLAMELLAADAVRRPQDWVDARSLLGVMTTVDIARTRDAIRLIEQRGFNRKRDLAADLDAMLRDQDSTQN